MRAEHEDEPLHRFFDPDPVLCRQQVEHEAGDGGNGEGGGDIVYGGQGSSSQSRIAWGGSPSNDHDGEAQGRTPQRRVASTVLGRRLRPTSTPRPTPIGGSPPRQSARGIAIDPAQSRVSPRRVAPSSRNGGAGPAPAYRAWSEGPQREVGDAIGHDVVDGTIKKFLPTNRIEGSGHPRAGSGQGRRGDSV